MLEQQGIIILLFVGFFVLNNFLQIDTLLGGRRKTQVLEI